MIIFKRKKQKRIDIKKFIFRDKQYGWGTKGSILGIKDGKMIVEPINSRTSSYYSFFLDGEIYRDCCYQCPFAQEKKSRRFNHWRLLGVEKYSSEIMEENGGDFFKKKRCILFTSKYK